MHRKWFYIFSILVLLIIISSFILIWTKSIPNKTAFYLVIFDIALFIARTVLRLYFFMKDRKN
jgi:hypothetical protein